MKKIFLLIEFIFSFCFGYSNEFTFKHVDVFNNLPNSRTLSIIKDKQGFMWLGTVSGLVRYDGYRLKVYLHDSNDSLSLPNNYIKKIMEDQYGNLWIKAGNYGYILYDSHTEQFVEDPYKLFSRLELNRKPDEVYIDTHYNIWIYSANHGLFLVPKDSSSFSSQLITKEALPKGQISDIKEYKEDILLVYNDGTIAYIDTKHLKIKMILSEISNEVNDIAHFSAYVDNEGDIWIHGASRLWQYKIVNNQWECVRKQFYEKNSVRALIQDNHGNIWVGLDHEGIEIINKSLGNTKRLNHLPNDKRTLPNDNISTLYKDKDGTIWVGTQKKGLAYYNEKVFKFSFYPIGDVNCVEDGGTNGVWLGTNDNGLKYLDFEQGNVKDYPLINYTNQKLSKVIVSLLKDSTNRLWVGTFLDGLYCLDGKHVKHFINMKHDENSLANNSVWALSKDEDNNIWIGTLGGGIQCYNSIGNVFTTYNSTNSHLVYNTIVSLSMMSDKRLVVGTQSSGIQLFDTEIMQFMPLTTSKNYQNYDLNLNQVFTDSRGLVWIGTREGLLLYNPRSKRIHKLESPFDNMQLYVTGIAEDHSHNMWVTSSNKMLHLIFSYNFSTDKYNVKYYIYDDKDGLQDCAFNYRSIKCLSSGKIVVGGMYGLNVLQASKLNISSESPKVIFPSFILFNEEVKVGKTYDGKILLRESLNLQRNITLRYKDNIFSVNFATNSNVLPEKNKYYYMLEGFSKQWITTSGDNPHATFTNLKPGQYILHVKAVNNSGVISEESSRLIINILPPFWLSIWAITLYAALFILLLVYIVYLIIHRERKKQRIQTIKQEAQKNEELNQMKFRFFTNISHELRTPLTLIITPLEELIKKEANNSEKFFLLQLMYRNASRLLFLVNQILDFRKNEVSKLTLNLTEGDIVSFLRDICNSFLIISENKNIQLQFLTCLKEQYCRFDEDKMNKIMMNLLINAFKYTPDGGKVDVSLDISDKQVVTIKVADTGIGITDEDKHHIFDRFWQSTRPDKALESGSGIGLSLVKEYVCLHQGNIKVTDNVDSGSIFIITLPLDTKFIAKTDKDKFYESTHCNNVEFIAKSNDIDNKCLNKPLVMIVDDNSDFLRFMQHSLSQYFEIITSTDGAKALELLKRNIKPQIIVSDVMMPIMDGYELCREIKNNPATSSLPFILLSAKQSVEDKIQGFELGADDYVTKPFNIDLLIMRMQKLILLSNNKKFIDIEPNQIEITPLDEKLVEQAICFVEEHLDDAKLSVESLSHELGMSRGCFYKKILQITGKTPIEFIRTIRMKRAAQLLRESQLNISEIAYAVGINRPKSFAQYFKDEFGELPSKYKEKYGK